MRVEHSVRNGLIVAPLMLLAGLTTGCGPGDATAENSAAELQAPAAPTSEIAAPAAAPAPVAEPAATLAALPFRRGFYVESGTACGEASAATLLLLAKDGVSGAHDSCTFRKIEQTGANTYRVTEECSAGASVATYNSQSDTSFHSITDNGRDITARYCAQSSLPDPWRDNDISDVTG